jgi:hypothetical protein
MMAEIHASGLLQHTAAISSTIVATSVGFAAPIRAYVTSSLTSRVRGSAAITRVARVGEFRGLQEVALYR